MPLRIPSSGDRPSWRELVVLFSLAAIVALILWASWRATRQGNTHPVFGDAGTGARTWEVR